MNNLNNIHALLNTYNIDILAITETHLSDDILDSEVSPQGYTVFHKDGGGVMLMVKDSIRVNPRYDLIPDCELIWLELSCPTVLIARCNV